MIETLLLLALVIGIVFLGSHDLAEFFLQKNETRVYWFKWWVVISIALGFAIWLILIYTGK